MLFLEQKEKGLVCHCLELFNTRMFLTAKITKSFDYTKRYQEYFHDFNQKF